MKKYLILPVLFCCLSLRAATQINTLIVATNTTGTTNGMNFALNTDTRTFTNNVFNSLVQCLTNTGPVGSASNLFVCLSNNVPAGVLRVTWDGGTNITLYGAVSSNMVASVSGNWGYVTNTTNTASILTAVTVPMSSIPTQSSATNMASELATNLSQYSTNAFLTNTPLLTNFMDLANTQTVPGAKTFTGAVILTNAGNSLSGGSQSNIIYLGNQSNSGGNIQLVSSTSTNGNILMGGQIFLSSYGTLNFFGGVGAGNFTLTGQKNVGIGQLALNGLTSGIENEAIGYDALLGNTSGGFNVAIGEQALYQNTTAGLNTAIGTQALAGNTTGAQNIGIGFQGGANLDTGTNNIDIGASGNSGESFITRIGSAGIQKDAYVAGVLHFDIAATGLITNSTINNIIFGGSNVFNGTIGFAKTNNSGLVNGPNSDLAIGTNAIVNVSGPSGAFGINGIVAGYDGQEVTIRNGTGFTMSMTNNSGNEATPANRLKLGNNGFYQPTNNPSWAKFRYDASSAFWELQFISN